ncbi:uncharacterized protein LOC132848039 [Tachysurus vachellii]|uniref:uncharacterized protein LOC132848039 n=1 Tax=Tachysurus vachellii TaxID=175792 RepID=UPI00296AAEA5|nr:uncharacterized protein LOC132848039 [Tachysurus vachellii]
MATGIQESSSTVRDLIQQSELISKGSPARRCLLTTRSDLYEDVSVRKWTFGQRDINMRNKIVLMVGETGTGKTTLINAMTNYILGVKFTDKVWFEITEEGGENQSNQSKSQTNKVTVYEVFTQYNPICLTIIDTPGYGDTRGTENDKQVIENLYKLFHNDSGVKEIDAVCLVLKASENRVSDRLQYIFDAVLSLFGKDIENNIVMFVTHSDGLPPTNALNAIQKAGIPCRKNDDNEPEHFLFNNRQREKRSLKYDRVFQTAWEQTEDSFNDFFTSLKEQNRKSLKNTESVMKESIRLEACILNLQNRIEFIECKSKELTQIQKALEENREMIKRNKNFPFTCWCYVMKNKHWTVCTGNKREEELITTEKKLKEEICEKEKEKAELVEEAYNTIMTLYEIALKPDSAFIVQSLDFLIPRAEETGREDLVQRLREMRKIQPEAEERVKAVTWYGRSSFNSEK